MDDQITAGLAEHFRRYRTRLADGEGRVGFKVAFNVEAVQARLGLSGSLVAGLTDRTWERGPVHSLASGRHVAVEAEVSVRLGQGLRASDSEAEAEAAIAAIAPAIEVVDYTRPLTEIREVLAEGVYHRAVVFGPESAPPQGGRVNNCTARAHHNGEVVLDTDAERATGQLPGLLLHVASVIEPHGLNLSGGDRLILGSMGPPVPVSAGDRFQLELLGLANVELTFEV